MVKLSTMQRIQLEDGSTTACVDIRKAFTSLFIKEYFRWNVVPYFSRGAYKR